MALTAMTNDWRQTCRGWSHIATFSQPSKRSEVPLNMHILGTYYLRPLSEMRCKRSQPRRARHRTYFPSQLSLAHPTATCGHIRLDEEGSRRAHVEQVAYDGQVLKSTCHSTHTIKTNQCQYNESNVLYMKCSGR